MVFHSIVFQCCCLSGFWSCDPNVLWGWGGEEDRALYALLSSGFVWMLLSLCTLISIVSGLRDSFPFSSFNGSFLKGEGEKNNTGLRARPPLRLHVHGSVITGNSSTHTIIVIVCGAQRDQLRHVVM